MFNRRSVLKGLGASVFVAAIPQCVAEVVPLENQNVGYDHIGVGYWDEKAETQKLAVVNKFSGELSDLVDGKSGYLFSAGAKWSPDGNYLAFQQGKALYTLFVDEQGKAVGEPRLVIESTDDWSSDPEWSPDGTKILSSSSEVGIFSIFNLADGTIEKYNLLQKFSYPTWSPDGASIAFLGPSLVGEREQVNVFHLATKKNKMLTEEHSGVLYYAWSVDGREIAYGDGDAKKAGPYLVDVSNEKRENLVRAPFSRVAHLNWSPDGKYLGFIGNLVDQRSPFATARLFVLERSTGRLKPLSPLEGLSQACGTDNFAWSPDGREILYQSFAEEQSSYLWVTDLAGKAVLLSSNQNWHLQGWRPKLIERS